MFSHFSLALMLALGSVQPAQPPEAHPSPEPPTGASAPGAAATSVSPVVVTGQRLHDSKQEFDRKVDSVTRSLAVTAPNYQLARWVRPLCVRVAGMSPAQGAALSARITGMAKELGLLLDHPGCLPNVDILMTDDPPGVIEALKKKDYPFVSFAEPGQRFDGASLATQSGVEALTNRDRAQFDRFVKGQDPVRVWHTLVWRTTDGTPGAQPDPEARSGFSHITTSGSDEVFCVLAVIDARQLENVQFDQLAGYILLQVFTQPDPKQQPAAPSILTLFADRAAGKPPQPGMTDWDRGFLKGLYAARGNANFRLQQSEIKQTLKSELRKPATQP